MQIAITGSQITAGYFFAIYLTFLAHQVLLCLSFISFAPGAVAAIGLPLRRTLVRRQHLSAGIIKNAAFSGAAFYYYSF